MQYVNTIFWFWFGLVGFAFSFDSWYTRLCVQLIWSTDFRVRVFSVRHSISYQSSVVCSLTHSLTSALVFIVLIACRSLLWLWLGLTPGYTGSTCATNINECASLPVTHLLFRFFLFLFFLSALTHVSRALGVGWGWGSSAETERPASIWFVSDMTLQGLCSFFVLCLLQVNAFSCSCVPGYSGVSCQTGMVT